MNIYFCSNYPCVIKADGKILEKISEKIFLFKKEGEPLIEVCPLVDFEASKAFYLNDEFFSSPPNHLNLVNLDGGYLINLKKRIGFYGFKMIYQERLENLLITVFNENGYKISIETNRDFYTENLDFEFKSVNAEIQYLNGYKFLCLNFVGEKSYLIIYQLNSIQKVFEKQVDKYAFSSNLVTEESVIDIKKHQVTSTWNFINDKFELINKSAFAKKQKSAQCAPTSILPYLFLEEFLVGGDFLEYLDEEMRSCANKLADYFGLFLGIMPPPPFRNFNEIGLIYKEKENLFKVNYFTFEMFDRKICNIIPVK